MKADVVNFYATCLKKYINLTNNIKNLKEGDVPPEQYELIEKQVATAKIDCERLGYVLFLLNKKPFRFNKNRRAYDRTFKEFFNMCKASDSYIFNELDKANALIEQYINTQEKTVHE